MQTASPILIDLRGAYDAKVPSLPEIESAVSQLLRAAGRTVSVTILRDSLELVYLANVSNLLGTIQEGGDQGDFLKAAFLSMAEPDINAAPDISKLRTYSDPTQDLFIWIVNYRRQASFDQSKLATLLAQVKAL